MRNVSHSECGTGKVVEEQRTSIEEEQGKSEFYHYLIPEALRLLAEAHFQVGKL